MSYQITVILTERQIHILKLLEEGYAQKEIAKSLSIGESNVRIIISRLMEQFNCKNSTQLIAYCVRKGII